VNVCRKTILGSTPSGQVLPLPLSAFLLVRSLLIFADEIERVSVRNNEELYCVFSERADTVKKLLEIYANPDKPGFSDWLQVDLC
jgi:hypothetical protein